MWYDTMRRNRGDSAPMAYFRPVEINGFKRTKDSGVATALASASFALGDRAAPTVTPR
jgi:hypothetical protein